MPTPGPLGRLVARRRMELGLTQQELADLTARHGVSVTQNNISRLESGKTQRINDPARLESLSKALGLESDAEFVIAAYAPNAERILPSMEVLPPGPDGEIVALIRRIPSVRKQYAIDFLRRWGEYKTGCLRGCAARARGGPGDLRALYALYQLS